MFDHLMMIDDTYIVDDSSVGIRAVNLRQLICYEKHDRKYILFFVNGTYEYDYRTGAKLLGNDPPKGFLQISRSTIINKAYLNHIFDDDVYLYNENKPRRISRHFKPAIYKYILSLSADKKERILKEDS
ncbi:MAG: LytTR family transcriptional regulator [Eubacterium sp.]|nr:LytTR family transcriptional regulator [Eubacterium sp.]